MALTHLPRAQPQVPGKIHERVGSGEAWCGTIFSVDFMGWHLSPQTEPISPVIDGRVSEIDFLASFLAIGIDVDVKFTSLIVHVIRQIISVKGATESRCARGAPGVSGEN